MTIVIKKEDTREQMEKNSQGFMLRATKENQVVLTRGNTPARAFLAEWMGWPIKRN